MFLGPKFDTFQSHSSTNAIHEKKRTNYALVWWESNKLSSPYESFGFINFGLEPVESVRTSLVISNWDCYRLVLIVLLYLVIRISQGSDCRIVLVDEHTNIITQFHLDEPIISDLTSTETPFCWTRSQCLNSISIAKLIISLHLYSCNVLCVSAHSSQRSCFG